MSELEASALGVKGFSPQEDYSKLDVLRYMPLERFFSLLEFEAMWFSRLGALQDKFECTAPQGFRAKVLALDALSMQDEELRNRLHAGPWPQMVATAEHGRNDDGRKMFAVNCWFIGKSESEKMWREYGAGGKGIAIRSTIQQLSTAFHIYGDYAKVSRVGRVEYVDFATHKMERPFDVLDVSFIKDKAYSEEQEARIVTLFSYHAGCLYPDGTQSGVPGAPVFLPQSKGFFIKCRLHRLIRSVIVGPNTPSDFRAVMKRIVSRYGLTIDVEYSQIPCWH